MNEQQLQEKIVRAVDARCAHLRPNPFLAQRILEEGRLKERNIVKRKMHVGLALTLILILLTATAVAAAILSGMELVETEAVPLAVSNDSTVRPVWDYSPESLNALILTAAENGITLDDDSSIMQAFRSGGGYNEEETIMAICREAFGGLHYEWTVEQKHWFQEMMIQIGWGTVNTYDLPGEGDMPSAQARALARKIIHDNYGADIPLDDPALYSDEEWFFGPDENNPGPGRWQFTFHPRALDSHTFHVSFDAAGGQVSHAWEERRWTDYTEQEVLGAAEWTYGYRTGSLDEMGPDGWYDVGQKLRGAKKSDKWSEEHDGYLATVYLLPGEEDIPMKQAREIAFSAAGVQDYTNVTEMLLGSGDRRIWKISFTTQEKTGIRRMLSYEIDSRTGGVLRWDDLTNELNWAKRMLQSTYEAVAPDRSGILTQEKAIAAAVEALHKHLNDPTIPYTDADCYSIAVRFNTYTSGYHLSFTPLTMAHGRASVQINSDGTADIWVANPPGLNADLLFDRFEDVYGPNIDWTQDMWVKFGEEMAKMAADPETAPTTFDARLFAKTVYLPESEVKIDREKALDIAYVDGDRSNINRLVLIDAEPNPVWKARVSTEPVTTLYEIDAMTGEILDKEYYFIQMSNFDHLMKMYTLRRDFMPAYLDAYGVQQVAMELCVKDRVEDYDVQSPDYMLSGAYRITEDGMTVTFTAVDPREDSYTVTVAEDAMSARIQVTPGVRNPQPVAEDAKAALYAALEGDGRFVVLEEVPELYEDLMHDGGPADGEMSLADAQKHAFSMLVDEIGQEAVDAFGTFAVGYRFSRFHNEGDCISWTFFFVDPEDVNVGFRVTFAIRDNELWGTGQVHDINDNSNG